MGLFDWLSDQTDTKNRAQAKDITQSPGYDPNASQFGAGGADAYAQQRGQQAAGIDQRGAFTGNWAGAHANNDNALAARNSQAQIAQMQMARAQGLVPSIAQMQADRQMQQATAAQASAAASARGPAALALAQQNAANNTANAQSQISNQAQINAANERLQAENAAMSGLTGIRQQDYTGQQNAANIAMFDAQMQQQNRQANDARAMGYEQMGHQALGQEQQGRLQQQGIIAGSQANANAANAGIARQNANTNMQFVGAALGAGQGIASGIGNMFSDARAKMGATPMGGGLMLSDVTSKTGLAQLGGPMGGGGLNPMSGPAQASFDKISGGGMDVLGSLKAHSNFGTRFQSDPTGGMVSDARAKDAARAEGLLAGLQIAGDDPGNEMTFRHSGAGAQDTGSHFAMQPDMAGAAGSQMTAQLAQGLEPYAYQYKPGFGTPGEKVGPMAQSMASNPVTATAVRQDPGTGLLSIDRDDGLKVALGGVGHLAQKQAQQDQMIAELLADRGRPNRRY